MVIGMSHGTISWLHGAWTTWAQLVLTLPIVAWCGKGFFRNAWRSLRHLSANMDTLVALGTGAAFAFSVADRPRQVRLRQLSAVGRHLGVDRHELLPKLQKPAEGLLGLGNASGVFMCFDEAAIDPGQRGQMLQFLWRLLGEFHQQPARFFQVIQGRGVPFRVAVQQVADQGMQCGQVAPESE